MYGEAWQRLKKGEDVKKGGGRASINTRQRKETTKVDGELRWNSFSSSNTFNYFIWRRARRSSMINVARISMNENGDETQGVSPILPRKGKPNARAGENGAPHLRRCESSSR